MYCICFHIIGTKVRKSQCLQAKHPLWNQDKSRPLSDIHDHGLTYEQLPMIPCQHKQSMQDVVWLYFEMESVKIQWYSQDFPVP